MDAERRTSLSKIRGLRGAAGVVRFRPSSQATKGRVRDGTIGTGVQAVLPGVVGQGGGRAGSAAAGAGGRSRRACYGGATDARRGNRSAEVDAERRAYAAGRAPTRGAAGRLPEGGRRRVCRRPDRGRGAGRAP